MRYPIVFLIFLLALVNAPAIHAERPNVLMIAVDDLATALGCYGDKTAITPHIDRLARSGVRFEHAYCQLPLCNPTRASIMTGLRPDTIEVYDLDRDFRAAVPDAVTLPQLFRQHGYRSMRVGKIFHYNVPASIGTNGADDVASWDAVFNPAGRDIWEEHKIENPTPEKKVSAALCWLAAEGSDLEQTDGMIATRAIELMRQHKDDSFFLAVGFFRPHTPYVAPQKYFDLYPLKSLRLPTAPADDRDDIPPAAFAHNCPIPHYGLDEPTCLKALQAYYACVSMVDAQVGRLLDALDQFGLAKNTVVVLWSDHGYHLGEHQGVWQKRCLFEESARAPLIIRAPGAAGNGRASKAVVEFVDIYPTIAEAAGLGIQKPLETEQPLEGRSIVPLLQNPDQPWNSAAVTQVLRPGDGQPVMGRSIRTDRWRYTEWNGGDAGRELYDHQADPQEFRNLESRPEYRGIIQRLRKRLDVTARSQPPTTPFNPSRL